MSGISEAKAKFVHIGKIISKILMPWYVTIRIDFIILYSEIKKKKMTIQSLIIIGRST